MRFTNNFNLFRTLQMGSQRMLRIFTMPLYVVWRKMQRFVNPNSIMTKVMGDVRKGFRKLISEKPSSLKDYFAFSRYYVAKKLVFVLIILMLILPVLYMQFLHPMVQSKFLTKTMYVNATEMQGYTGKVELLSEESQKILYDGKLENGRVTGKGTLYDHKGRRVYTGGFLMEMYEGEGESYYANGRTKYKGTFSMNKYEGMGILYTKTGSIKYEGGFSGGLYNGDGKLYYNNGRLMFAGPFANGKFNGAGTIYGSSGQIVYTGELKDGKFDGKGILYQNGKKLYDGEFSAGKLAGKGIIFSGKNIIYDGEFLDNAYSGAGKSYDPVTKALIYDGEFSSGQYNGAGKLFDVTGGLIYDGEFYNGSYEGEGKLFDPVTEMPLYEGGFRAGRYDGQGTEYASDNGSLVYEGVFLLGSYNGKGILYNPYSGLVEDEGVFQGGTLLADTGAGADAGTGSDAGAGADAGADGATPPTEEAGTPGTSDAGAGKTPPPVAPGGKAEKIYSGPKDGENIDYQGLAAMKAEAITGAFATEGSVWELDKEIASVYEDVTEGIGITVHKDAAGKSLGIDVWNDGKVAGVSPGMTKEAISSILGKPLTEKKEAMGEGRMVSVSQSNRFHGRLTNLSAESTVEVVTYKTEKGILRAVFVKGDDKALIIEVRGA